MKRIFLLLLSLCLVLSACAPGENAVSSEAPLSTVPEETAPRETLTPTASEPASAETAAGPSASPEAPTAPAQPAKIPEEPSVPTVLCAFTAGPNAADNRRQISSNSTQSWCRKASVGAETALTLDTWNFYNNYDTGKGGLHQLFHGVGQFAGVLGRAKALLVVGAHHFHQGLKQLLFAFKMAVK